MQSVPEARWRPTALAFMLLVLASAEAASAGSSGEPTGSLEFAGDSLVFSLKNETSQPIFFHDTISGRSIPRFTVFKLRTSSGELPIPNRSAEGWWSPFFYSSEMFVLPVELSMLAPGEAVEASWDVPAMLVGPAKNLANNFCKEQICEIKVRVSVGLDPDLKDLRYFETEWAPLITFAVNIDLN